MGFQGGNGLHCTTGIGRKIRDFEGKGWSVPTTFTGVRIVICSLLGREVGGVSSWLVHPAPPPHLPLGVQQALEPTGPKPNCCLHLLSGALWSEWVQMTFSGPPLYPSGLSLEDHSGLLAGCPAYLHLPPGSSPPPQWSFKGPGQVTMAPCGLTTPLASNSIKPQIRFCALALGPLPPPLTSATSCQ